ncbi:MAG: glycosyltransferase N-terminal domain-containing protein [Deferrisomatales bacterium]|nr:glycosyltransferase N-terminal domain-containing protein [Deferrisomatales bacterium]
MNAFYAAYQALGWAGLAVGWPVILLRALRDPRYRVGWGERLGRWGQVPTGGIWVHGASVGEMRAAAPLISALQSRGVPLVLSTTSPGGRETARALAGPGGAGRLLPLDLGPLVRRAIAAARPRALVVVETELWPGLLRAAAAARVPAVLVNARLSDRAFPRYLRLGRWLAPFLGAFRIVLAQSEEDARRFRALGVSPDRVAVGGNLKYDLPAPDPSGVPVRALRRGAAGGWQVVVAGSTHPGEEAAVLRAAGVLEARGRRLGVVLAPRHLERLAEVEAAVRTSGREPRRWSGLGEPPEAGILEAFQAGQVLLVDRYGLLGGLYGGADCAFVGGSLAPVGGHNLLEPLNWGTPVVFGPHTQNAREVRDEVLRRGLGTEVIDAAGLADALGGYLEDEGAREALRRGSQDLFAANRGAVERAVKVLEELGAWEDR